MRRLQNARDLFFPPLCIVCDCTCAGANPWLCGHCLSKLEMNGRERVPCPRCGQDMRYSACACEFAWDFPFERIVSLFDFDDAIKHITHAFKYRGLSRLAFDMGKTFGGLIPRDFFTGMDVVVPVPLHAFRKLSRGYNQAEHFAAGIRASCTSSPALLNGVLKRRKYTRTQTALSRQGRLQNLSGAFIISGPERIKGRSAILVDDIVTTGATTGQCAQALLDAGARTVRVLSFARD
jgi:competence protein ComFC